MIHVNEIDWNEAWKKPDNTEGQKQGFISCGRRWKDPDRCRRFNASMKKDDWAASEGRIQAMDIQPTSRILDVGAGPGTLTIPMAGIARHVTAVEPSEGMLACLHDNIIEKGYDNITVVPKKWENVDISTDLSAPFDIVVASYSLGFPDLREGLQKMNDASGRYVYIFWFADMMSPWQRRYAGIWEELFGIPLPPGRKPNIIFNLLHQMGIFANVEITKEESIQHYMSIEEAIADQREGLNLTTPDQDEVLKQFLLSKLQYEDGIFKLRDNSYRAKIWWRKEE